MWVTSVNCVALPINSKSLLPRTLSVDERIQVTFLMTTAFAIKLNTCVFLDAWIRATPTNWRHSDHRVGLISNARTIINLNTPVGNETLAQQVMTVATYALERSKSKQSKQDIAFCLRLTTGLLFLLQGSQSYIPLDVMARDKFGNTLWTAWYMKGHSCMSGKNVSEFLLHAGSDIDAEPNVLVQAHQSRNWKDVEWLLLHGASHQQAFDQILFGSMMAYVTRDSDDEITDQEHLLQLLLSANQCHSKLDTSTLSVQCARLVGIYTDLPGSEDENIRLVEMIVRLLRHGAILEPNKQCILLSRATAAGLAMLVGEAPTIFHPLTWFDHDISTRKSLFDAVEPSGALSAIIMTLRDTWVRETRPCLKQIMLDVTPLAPELIAISLDYIDA